LAKKTRKCARCKIDDTNKDDMIIEVVGVKKPVNKFYHKKCHIHHLKEKKFKAKEKEELDILIEVIKKIYGAKTIPNGIYPFLQDLRNGTKFFGRDDYKYKKGYSYILIAKTFEYCSETIQYWNSKKDFGGLTNALRYALAIVCDKLSLVESRIKENEMRESIAERKVAAQNIDNEIIKTVETKSGKGKKTDEMDISDLLN